MTDPISFSATTPRHAFPNLFSAQAQKEFTVNEALARLDMLLHAAVEATRNDPPPTPAEGQCWIVGAAPTGDWVGHAGEIAGWQAGNWIYATPRAGMTVFDASTAALVRYDNGWNHTVAVAEPTGGTTEDSEARAAIIQLIAALITAGILPAA